MSKEQKSVKLFEYKGVLYPEYIRNGNAVEHIVPTAKKFCVGEGLDIGGTEDWCLPGATPINLLFADDFDAYQLPVGTYDYIFSSHCLEHLPNYIEALEIWRDSLRPGGVLFLYLPHTDMEYWRPQNCRKHLHEFYPYQMVDVLKDLGFKNVINSERDLYWSFCVVGYKR